MIGTSSALIVCLLFFCADGVAQSTQPPSPLPPDKFFFTGDWNCVGTFRGDKIHKSAFNGSLILGGTWIELNEEDLVPTTGYKARYLIGYDPAQKRVIEFNANNFGPSLYSSELGWQGNVLTMTSALSSDDKAPYAINRFVYSIITADNFTVDWQVSRTSAPNWIEADYLSCNRLPKR